MPLHNNQNTGEPALRNHSRDHKLWSPKTCGLLPQVNYSERCEFGGLKGRSLNTDGFNPSRLIRTGSTVG